MPIISHTIDAKGKRLGRIASQAATILMGKNEPSYKRNVAPAVRVEIINTKDIAIGEKKIQQKKYMNYSGYPGGLYATSLKDLIEKKGLKEAVRLAVYGMLPTNKLRSRMMTRLVIKD